MRRILADSTQKNPRKSAKSAKSAVYCLLLGEEVWHSRCTDNRWYTLLLIETMFAAPPPIGWFAAVEVIDVLEEEVGRL